jgi:exopolysaccharide production protein ExoZ
MRPTLDNLQSLRGLACLAVVLYHVYQWEAKLGIRMPFFGIYKWFGYAGVDVFFVISGFIIAYSTCNKLGRPSQLGRYLLRRVWRIYPAYWVALAISIGLTRYAQGHTLHHIDWSANAASWFGLWPSTPHLFIPQAWTLSYELLFYAAFGVLFLLPLRLGAALLSLCGGTIVVLTACGWQSTNEYTYFVTSPYVLEFLAGCVASWVVRRGWTSHAPLAMNLALIWVVVACVVVNRRDPTWLMVTPAPRVLVFGPPAALLVYSLVAGELRRNWQLPTWTRTLGDASYSIYLLHMPMGFAMMTWTTHWSHRRLPHIGWSLAMLTVCVGSGLLMYRLIEKPLLKVVKSRTRVAPLDDRQMSGVQVFLQSIRRRVWCRSGS